MNYRPTDTAIKSSVMFALGSSIFAAPYSILAQGYRQNDHANKTWTDLRMDIESNISNKIAGTSRNPEIHNMRQRDRSVRDWHCFPSRFNQPPAESRSSRELYDAYYHYESCKRPSDNNASPHPKMFEQPRPPAKQPPPPNSIPAPIAASGDHRATKCDRLKCFTCQATFPTAALRQAHYMSTHRRDPTTKRARFAPISSNPRNQYTLPSSPFLS